MFSFGGSSSKSTSEANSLDVGANASQSFSDSLSTAVSGGKSSQSLAFEDLFAKLYGGASGAAGKAAGMVPLLQGQAGMLFNSGSKFLEGLEGGAGRDFLESRINGENPLMQEQIDSLGADLGKFFNEQINPNISLKGVAAGGMGGSRQGVAQGMATAQLANEFQKGALGIRVADMTARDAAARDLIGLDNQAAGIGLGGLGSMYGIAESGAMAGMLPYQALASIMGGPTTLTESNQFSDAQSTARSVSESFGFNYGTSQSKSKGKSKSASFGF